MSDMSIPSLAEDLEFSLLDTASVFEGQLGEVLHAGLALFSRYKPQLKMGTLDLVAGQRYYDCPTDFVSFVVSLWAEAHRTLPRWHPDYPVRLPRPVPIRVDTGRQLLLDHAPTDAQVSAYGVVYPFTYRARHSISATAEDTTVPEHHRDLLLLCGQIEAMRRMIARNIRRSAAVNDAVSGQPRNGTPMAVYRALMDELREQAKND